MPASPITVGILSPSAETREILRIQINATGLAAADVELEQYCSSPGDRQVRRLAENPPDIIIVDMVDPKSAIQTLNTLHMALPDAWLFVSAAANDPQLIIETMRAGAREFLPKPIPPRNLTQAFARFLSEKQRFQEQRGAGKVYCVTSAKGGSGATSVAINLAMSLAKIPHVRGALIDLNCPVGDVAAQLNIKPQFTVADALASASRLDNVLLESLMTHTYGISVLPGPKEYQPGQITGVDILAKMLDVTARCYSHVVVDLPSSMDREHLQVISELATGILVVCTPELPALWRTERLLKYMGAVGNPEKLHLILNRSQKYDEINEEEIARVLKMKVYWKLPNNYRGSIEAINSGKPLVSINNSDLSHSYRDLAHKLTGFTETEKKRRMFGIL